MCAICFFIVMKNKTQKYITKMGQKTGTSNIGKKVIKNDVVVPRKQTSQNLNSGNLLVKGLYSSELVVGNVGSSLGSSSGERNAMKLLRRKIPRP
mmetsp:Transcript_22642/g.33146  ORF Transcript_22642/g.33146 Transcript_22642/m.33146 type:complete len:95 (-) Transcript_22642:340-624(-)